MPYFPPPPSGGGGTADNPIISITGTVTVPANVQLLMRRVAMDATGQLVVPADGETVFV